MDAQENCTVAFRTDRHGKVFKVLAAGVRKCLICEQVFTRQACARTRKCGVLAGEATIAD